MFCKCLAPLCALSQKGTQLANLLQPISNLAIRIWLGYEFFKSGLLKTQDWDTTLLLFEEEHPLPLVSPEIGALIGVGGELIFPILLFLGLATRIGGLGTMAMAIFAEVMTGHFIQHTYWMLLSAYIITYGGSKLSLDYVIQKMAPAWYKSDSDPSI